MILHLLENHLSASGQCDKEGTRGEKLLFHPVTLLSLLKTPELICLVTRLPPGPGWKVLAFFPFLSPFLPFKDVVGSFGPLLGCYQGPVPPCTALWLL